MNKIDEYWFWSSKAITDPNISNNFYYFNKVNFQLFSLKKEENKLLPIFRNAFTSRNLEYLNLFHENIILVLSSSPNIILLPKLYLDEKKNFLLDFVSRMRETELKYQLLNEANMLTAKDEFNFKTVLKEQKNLFFDFDFEKGVYVAKRIRELYNPLGINEEVTVLW